MSTGTEWTPENPQGQGQSALSFLLCSECRFWLNINYPEWGQCEKLQDRIGVVLVDSDATEIWRIDTPKNFGCILGERKA